MMQHGSHQSTPFALDNPRLGDRHRAVYCSERQDIFKRMVAGFLVFAFVGTIFGADSPQPVETMNSTPGVGVSFLRMFGAMIVVIAVFLLGVWFFQNWSRVLARSGKAGRLQIVEGRSLGNRQALYVVGYDRQRWLIGSSQTGISVIGVLPEAPENAAPAGPPPPQFMSVLQKMISRKP